MRAEKVIRSLLMAASGVTAIVSTRCYAPPLKQGQTYPALLVEAVSTAPIPTIDASASYRLVRARIQVTAYAADLSTVKSLVEAVRVACDYKHGTIADVSVASVLCELVGPDEYVEGLYLYRQLVDFYVTLKEE